MPSHAGSRPKYDNTRPNIAHVCVPVAGPLQLARRVCGGRASVGRRGWPRRRARPRAAPRARRGACLARMHAWVQAGAVVRVPCDPT
eukprot:1165184-Prymnesium_polylepis.1